MFRLTLIYNCYRFRLELYTFLNFRFVTRVKHVFNNILTASIIFDETSTTGTELFAL